MKPRAEWQQGALDQLNDLSAEGRGRQGSQVGKWPTSVEHSSVEPRANDLTAPLCRERHLRTYPDLSASCLKRRLDLALRLWYILRQHCGRGWLPIREVFDLSCGNRRQTRAWLRKGKGIFWARAGGDHLYLEGLGAVCEILGVDAKKAPVAVPLEDIEDLGKFRAVLFSCFFAHREMTISQKRLGEIFGRTARTLYTWARLANVDIQHNLAWSPIPDDGDDLDRWPAGTMKAMGIKVEEEETERPNNVWQESWRDLPRKGWRWQRGNEVVLCWQLPNTYFASDLVVGPKTGLQKKAARRGRRAPENVAGANGGYVKLFWEVGQAGAAAKSLQSGAEVAFLAEGVKHHDRQLWSFNVA